MISEPRLEQCAPQVYVGIRSHVTENDFITVIDEGWPKVFGWLAEHSVAYAGAPFIRYFFMGATGLIIELGVPVAAGTIGGGDIITGELPPGRYLTMQHVGPYGGIHGAHEALQRWALDNNIALDRTVDDAGERWAAFIEHYPTNPREEPEPSKWITEIAYLTR